MSGRLTATRYVVARGLRGMGQSSSVQVLAVGTMVVCMLLLGTTGLIWHNVRGTFERWGMDVPVTVYLAEQVRDGEREALAQRLEALPQIDRVEYIPPEMALQRLADGLGSDSDALEGVDPNVLPQTLEVTMADGTSPGFTGAMVARLREQSVVEDVAAVGPWAAEAERLMTTIQRVALGIGLLVSFACVAIVWSTIRLGVFARRAELKILRLVGGTARFCHGPFVVEGLLQGAIAASLAMLLLYAGFDALRPMLEDGMALIFAGGGVRFFDPLWIGGAVLFGATLGMIGSRTAVARYAEGD